MRPHAMFNYAPLDVRVSLSAARSALPSAGFATTQLPVRLPPEPYSITVQVLLALILGTIILVTIIGNIFVILACCLDRTLKRPSNYLIVSLAVADLLVGIAVMPFSAYYEVQRYRWQLGGPLCDVWCTSDVLCCSASILHLVAIALDRYWSITDVVYVQNKSIARIRIMIIVAWAVAAILSVAPIMGWKDSGHADRINGQECTVSQELSYQIFATSTSFYVPLLFIMGLYIRIFFAARQRIRKRPVSGSNMLQALKNVAHTTLAATPSLDKARGEAQSQDSLDEFPDDENADKNSQSLTNQAFLPKSESQSKLGSLHRKITKRKVVVSTLEAKRERKAAKTLVIVTGIFIICWLPFFLLALIRPIGVVKWHPKIDSFFLWLGYVNSMANPVIYTIFSPDFRSAFRKLLCRGR